MTLDDAEAGTRLLVVTDEDGNIQAATVRPSGNPIGDPPSQVEFIPGDDQTVHEVDVPEELRSAQGLLSLLEFNVHVEEGQARLVKKPSAS